MTISDLSLADQEVVRRVLVYQIGKWDWESPTVLGAPKLVYESLVANWPVVRNEALPEVTYAAIHNALGDVVGLRGIRDDICMNELGASPDELLELFKRWSGKDVLKSPLDLLT